jgi:hypothetical protein
MQQQLQCWHSEYSDSVYCDTAAEIHHQIIQHTLLSANEGSVCATLSFWYRGHCVPCRKCARYSFIQVLNGDEAGEDQRDALLQTVGTHFSVATAATDYGR